MSHYDFNVDELSSLYAKWNQENIQLTDHGDFIEITTPYVDNHHDFIHVIMFYKNGRLILSDDGFTLSELALLEIDYKKSTKRKDFLNQTLNSFGVKISAESELFIEVESIENYPKKLINFIQCIVRISDMLLTSRNTVTNIFFEEVFNLFEDHSIPFSSELGITGKTGNSQQFDFIIPRIKQRHEKIIKTVNKPNKDSFQMPLLSFLDIKDYRQNSDFVVIANDNGSKIDDKFLTSLKNHDIQILPWSEKDLWIKDLA